MGKQKKSCTFPNLKIDLHKYKKKNSTLAALFFGKLAEEENEEPNYEDIIMEDKTQEFESEFDSLPILEPPTDEAFG